MKSATEDSIDPSDDLLEVSCPDCGQGLSLKRKYLGGHCLCSTCDGLMLVSVQETMGGQRTIVTEMLDKATGNKIAGVNPTIVPDKGGAVINKDTKPVKPWPNEYKNPVTSSATAETSAAAGDSSDELTDLLQTNCPDCHQELGLGREYIGGHCVCSSCEALMLVSAREFKGRGRGRLSSK